MLLATAPTELVEASPHDVIWGAGLGEHHPDITDKSKWRGQNLLGQALMKVRDTLKP
ncbi:NADAR domain-containing protein [Caballeronia calidae]|uniref:NADAR domain-containing protein n=1 Tax=Caballeronia calidae TaxID=1777139 RepID=UPI0035B567F9